MSKDPQHAPHIAVSASPRLSAPAPHARRLRFVPKLRLIFRQRAMIRATFVAALVLALIPAGLFVRARAMRQPVPPMPLPYAFVQSCNCDDRPPGAVVNCIVLHATVEPTTEGTMNLFLTPERKVSAHFVVGRDGRVVQMVRLEQRAWHAGASLLDGVDKVNDFSVGIEMVNLNDGKDPYPQPQIDAVAGIIRFIRSRYDVPDARIVSHAEIALPPGRKSDPKGFDFDKIRALARVAPAAIP